MGIGSQIFVAGLLGGKFCQMVEEEIGAVEIMMILLALGPDKGIG
jgi:hypothetical protein